MRGLKFLCMPANTGESKLSRLAFRIRGASSDVSLRSCAITTRFDGDRFLTVPNSCPSLAPKTVLQASLLQKSKWNTVCLDT
jgi:hypothetical protein